MKMYIWHGPIIIRYGGSVAVAVAENMEAAKKIAFASLQDTGRIAPKEIGDADEILDLEDGFVYTWSE